MSGIILEVDLTALRDDWPNSGNLFPKGTEFLGMMTRLTRKAGEHLNAPDHSIPLRTLTTLMHKPGAAAGAHAGCRR